MIIMMSELLTFLFQHEHANPRDGKGKNNLFLSVHSFHEGKCNSRGYQCMR